MVATKQVRVCIPDEQSFAKQEHRGRRTERGCRHVEITEVGGTQEEPHLLVAARVAGEPEIIVRWRALWLSESKHKKNYAVKSGQKLHFAKSCRTTNDQARTSNSALTKKSLWHLYISPNHQNT